MELQPNPQKLIRLVQDFSSKKGFIANCGGIMKAIINEKEFVIDPESNAMLLKVIEKRKDRIIYQGFIEGK